MNGDIKENVTRRGIWLRLCFMIIMGAACSVAEVIIGAVVVFQFLSSLVTGETNDQLVRFGRNLARYVQQIVAYLTFATEEIPFPFAPWPDEPDPEAPAADEVEPLFEPPPEPPEPPPPSAPPPPTPPEPSPPPEPPEPEVKEPEEDVAPPAAAEQPDDEPKDTHEAAAETGEAAPPGPSAAAREDIPEPTEPETEEEERAGETRAAETAPAEIFGDSTAYEKFMGDRSRLSGERLVAMLDLPPRLSWLDVGCGTGALSAVILETCDPSALIGIDSSGAQVTHVQSELGSERASFRVADATALPFGVDSFDVAVSSYVLNFVADKQKMVDEMARVVRPEGTVAITVFDVAGGRQTTYPIWELIGRNDPAFHRAEFEKRGWDITNPADLTAFFENAGLEDVSVESIEIDETFADFDEYWDAMTTMSTTGTSQYISRLDGDALQKFRDDLRALMPIASDGTINLITGSWLVRGKVPA